VEDAPTVKKLLIVSPHFPPVNAPDMQRVRLALPFLRAHGWEPTVLAVEPNSIEHAVHEPKLLETFPADIRVVRVNGIPARLTRRVGIGSLWWRCRRALTRAGDRLLAGEKFDLVFLSTTQFGFFALGPRWRKQFGVPFVVDYQDLWKTDHYAQTGAMPPGGRFKFAISQFSARRVEPRVLRMAAGVVTVSEHYGPALASRHSWFDAKRVRVLPFGAAARDFEQLAGHRPEKPLIDFSDGNVHYVYAGRGGDDLDLALTILFTAFAAYRRTHPSEAERVRFHFLGTDYAATDASHEKVRPIAQRVGVERYVHEHPVRIAYFDALYYLKNAAAIVMVGSNDVGYSGSKLFPCVLARRPLLLIFPRESPILSLVEKLRAGVAFGFGDSYAALAVANEVHERWFAASAVANPAAYDEGAFSDYTAAAMTAKLAQVFSAAIA
jgi:hypothetical protein